MTMVARYAAVADIFVLPSLLEALPTVAVEALAAERRSSRPIIQAASSCTKSLAMTCRWCRGRTQKRWRERLEDALATPRRTPTGKCASSRSFQPGRRVQTRRTTVVAVQMQPCARSDLTQ